VDWEFKKSLQPAKTEHGVLFPLFSSESPTITIIMELLELPFFSGETDLHTVYDERKDVQE
jgi:hypothetical protein